MVVSDAHVFPGFLTPVLKQLFFPKPPTTFLTCFCRGERQKYAGKNHNHQVMSLTHSPLSLPGGAKSFLKTFSEKEKIRITSIFFPFSTIFSSVPKQISQFESNKLLAYALSRILLFENMIAKI